jgi:hypothetical protein
MIRGGGHHESVKTFMSLGPFPLEASNGPFLTVDREKMRQIREWLRRNDEIPPVQFPPEAQRRTRLPRASSSTGRSKNMTEMLVGK